MSRSTQPLIHDARRELDTFREPRSPVRATSRHGSMKAKARGGAAQGSPLLSDVGVIAMVPDHWRHEWQPRHQLMSRLGRYFNVVWVNPAPHWREIGRRRTPGPPPAPGMEIYDPDRWLPSVHRPPALSAMLLKARVLRARHLLEVRGVKTFVLYIWRPEFVAAVGLPGFDLTCYHVDDEYTFSTADEPIRAAERHLLLNADQVFIHSRALMEKKGHLNPHTLRVPNGVDMCAFAGAGPVPADLAAVPRPRIGYAGYIKDQLDWRLLTELAERRPDLSLVLVGIDKIRQPDNRRLFDQLAARDNVHLLGNKTTEELALYPRHFDICIMPYLLNGYTRYIYPLKLHEYLATGRPVLGTPIDALLEYRHVVSLASTASEWTSVIDDTLAGDSRAGVEARIATATRYDWNILARRVAATIATRLREEHRLPRKAAPAESVA